jgi:hypothetical protein
MAALTQARFGGTNYNFAIAGGGPSGVTLSSQTYNGKGWCRAVLLPRPGYRYEPRLARQSHLIAALPYAAFRLLD